MVKKNFVYNYPLFYFKKLKNFNSLSFFNGALLENQTIDKISSKRQIRIESASEKNNGVYKIIAKNEIGKDEASWNVTVECA
jgi:hypothetical protein